MMDKQLENLTLGEIRKTCLDADLTCSTCPIGSEKCSNLFGRNMPRNWDLKTPIEITPGQRAFLQLLKNDGFTRIYKQKAADEPLVIYRSKKDRPGMEAISLAIPDFNPFPNVPGGYTINLLPPEGDWEWKEG